MEEGVSVSAWLSDAAQDRIRNRSLRNALDVDEPEIAALSDSELQVLVDRARANIVVTKPKRSTNSEAPGAEAA